VRPTPVFISLGIAVAVVAKVGVDASWGGAIVAGIATIGILRFGWVMIAGLAQPVPEPPDPGELRKVKMAYRCQICGTEVRMTVAAAEDPEPPRHCLEDMELLTPIE